MTAPTIRDPECCGSQMVHNSFTGCYECADAYFALVDDGVLGDCGDLAIDCDERCVCSTCRAWRALYAHWQTTQIPDGWDR